MEQKFYSSTLLSKTMLTEDIMILVFERPKNFNFVSGQFVQFKIPQMSADSDADERASSVLRSYSISSHPSEPTLEFCVKIIPSGKASEYFVRLAVGESARITEAKGVFVCAQDTCTQKVFIATGAGIAPIKSMILDAINLNGSIHLLFGLRHEKDLFWLNIFDALTQQNKGFSYNVTLSQPSPSWAGLKGWVSKHLPPVTTPASYYVCGSVEMVKDVRALLLNQGVGTKSVHFEIF